MSMSVKKKTSHSWEEQAFVEDARGPFGGFVWPTRSYSCSFCTREFRSAQALGGHMNVHRRAKAKLEEIVNKNHDQERHCKESLHPAPFFHFRVSLRPSLRQKSLYSSSNYKSCVYDEDLVVTGGNEDINETTLALGFDLDSCSDIGGGGGVKRRKKNHVIPAIIEGGLDLELRLAS